MTIIIHLKGGVIGIKLVPGLPKKASLDLVIIVRPLCGHFVILLRS